MTVFVPRDYQHAIRDAILHKRRVNVFSGMGTGKGPTTLHALDILNLFGEVNRTLVLGPKRVALSTWPGEAAKFANLRHRPVVAAVGTPEERLRVLRSSAPIVSINYDVLEWLVETMGDSWDFDTVVADESTRLKGLRVGMRTSKTGKQFLQGQGAIRARRIAKVAHTKVRRWINLTGSPAPNGLQDLWGQMWFVDGGQRLGRSFTAFQNRWFRSVPNADGYPKIEALPFAQEQIEAAIKDVCITIEARDFMDLPPLVESEVFVDLPPKARDAYRQLEREFFTEFAGHEFEAFNSGAKMQKCLQFASGAAYTDPSGAWALVHDEKIDALRSVIEEANGMPVLVAYQFKSDLQRILKAFPKKARHLDASPRTIDAWNAGDIPILAAHPASAGHGLSLQDGSNILCDFSTGFNLELDEQIVERIGPTRQAQSGHNRPVYRRRIIARDTLEHRVVLPCIRRKSSLQDALRQAMKLTKHS
jgi:SNF2 family DNA or RNA helicase